jgi:hypothetical protein
MQYTYIIFQLYIFVAIIKVYYKLVMIVKLFNITKLQLLNYFLLKKYFGYIFAIFSI